MNDRSKSTIKNTLNKQQWAKSLSTHFAMNLSVHNPDSPMKQSYDNTYHCNSVKRYNGEKLTSTYCKNRWCYTCSRIRTAINIKNYAPELAKMDNPFFVTLTRPTVTSDDLVEQIASIEKAWRLIYNYSKKQSIKNAGIFLKGVRSVECTLRDNGHFHYHMHIIVDGKENAEWIKEEWLKRNEDSKEAAQDIRPADKGALLEVFKYSVKMSVNMQKTADYKRLDTLFQALKGKRTTSTFGGLKIPKGEAIEAEDEIELESQFSEELQLRLGSETSVWVWSQDVYDWINSDTGELLINEPLPKKILEVVKGDKSYT